MSFVSAFAPGRVELLGNHTDYNGGVVLSAALGLGISVQGQPRDDAQIKLTTDGNPEAVTADLATLKPAHTWADYPLGVVKVLRKAGYPVAGFEAHFSSTLPIGAGLSSSAAIEVCTGVLLMRMFGFTLDRLELAKQCRDAENHFVGMNCGLLDQVSSIFGQAHHAISLDCRSETVENIPFPDGVELLIIHSGVKHALTGGEYNERRAQCFEAAKILGVPALRDVTMAQLEAAQMPDLIKRRARHIVGENERVFAAIADLRQGNAAAMGQLMFASHRSSMENFENSTPELDALVALAKDQPGILGARLTGGGFGGAIVALVAAEESQRAGEEIVSNYAKKTGNTAQAYRCAISDGALPAL